MWIVSHAQAQLGFKPEHVILTGDSAGGHLSVSVAILALLRGFRVPDAILSSYPVCMINRNRFFPSVLFSMDEEVLSQTFMQFALTCFLRKGGNPDNPVLSPSAACDEILRGLPHIEMVTAEADSLRDNSIYMLYRLLKAGNTCKMHLMKEFVHGFHNMDIKLQGIDEYRRATHYIIALFRQMFTDLANKPVEYEKDFQVISEQE